MGAAAGLPSHSLAAQVLPRRIGCWAFSLPCFVMVSISYWTSPCVLVERIQQQLEQFPRYGFARTSHRTDVLRPKQPRRSALAPVAASVLEAGADSREGAPKVWRWRQEH